MNKFVRNFIILPLILLFLLFNVGVLGACACGSVRDGQKVELTIKTKGNNSVDLPNYKKIIYKLITDINGKWFWDSQKKKTSLIEKVKTNTKLKDADVKKFIVDYLTTDNNHFKHFVFHTEATKADIKDQNYNLPEFFGKKDGTKNTLDTEPTSFKLDGYFYVVKEQKFWELSIEVKGVKIIGKEKDISGFDLTDADLKITSLESFPEKDFKSEVLN